MLLLSTSFLALVQIPEYVLDTTWAPAFPPGAHTFSGVAVQYGRLYVTQRGNTSLEPILLLNTTDGRMQTSFGSSEIGISKSTPPTWGAHGIATTYVENVDTRVYINDFTSFMLWGFDQRSPDFAPWSKATRAALRIGTPGKQGVGNDPVQFGHLADTAVHHPPYVPPYTTNHIVYVADGDGGSANRIVALATSTGHPPDWPSKAKFLWATPSNYHNPHSITYHERTNLLLVADRENNRTRVLQSSDGKDLGNLECGLDLGPRGKPFGVRTWSSATADLLFMAIMDNPQDGMNQKIAVLDISGLQDHGPTPTLGSPTPCKIAQLLDVPTSDSGPHLLGVDYNGDVYAALVADSPRSTVLRYTIKGTLEERLRQHARASARAHVA